MPKQKKLYTYWVFKSRPLKMSIWVPKLNFPENLKGSDRFESVTFKMTHFAFVNKGQILFVIKLILTLIDKCKMCHFECHALNFID